MGPYGWARFQACRGWLRRCNFFRAGARGEGNGPRSARDVGRHSLDRHDRARSSTPIASTGSRRSAASDPLPSNTVLNLFEDVEKNIWIGTQGGHAAPDQNSGPDREACPTPPTPTPRPCIRTATVDLWVAAVNLFRVHERQGCALSVSRHFRCASSQCVSRPRRRAVDRDRGSRRVPADR